MQALQMSMAFILPSVFFSGFIFPRETMPWIFYALGSLLPTTYFIALMRAIILRGATFLEYWPSLAILIDHGRAPFLRLRAPVSEEDRVGDRITFAPGMPGRVLRILPSPLDEDRHVQHLERTKVASGIGRAKRAGARLLVAYCGPYPR